MYTWGIDTPMGVGIFFEGVPGMHLYVAGYRYGVFLVPNLTNPKTGEEIMAWTNYLDREFYLDLATPAHCRREHLLHEYHHAWEYYLGVPDDAETRCNHFAAAVTQFTDGMDRAGGPQSLHCLEVRMLNDQRIPRMDKIKWHADMLAS